MEPASENSIFYLSFVIPVDSEVDVTNFIVYISNIASVVRAHRDLFLFAGQKDDAIVISIQDHQSTLAESWCHCSSFLDGPMSTLTIRL